MRKALEHIRSTVALLALGSAILLVSCKKNVVVEQLDEQTLMTMMSDTLSMVQSQNGKTKMRFDTPLMERYQLAKEPYMEFRRGVHVITYDDSTAAVASTACGGLCHIFREQGTLGGERQRGGYQCRRTDALYSAVVLESENAQGLLECRFQDYAGQRHIHR